MSRAERVHAVAHRLGIVVAALVALAAGFAAVMMVQTGSAVTETAAVTIGLALIAYGAVRALGWVIAAAF